MKKLTLSAMMLATLTACMGSSAQVERAKTGVSAGCADLGIHSALTAGGNYRCGPQAELPYTLG